MGALYQAEIPELELLQRGKVRDIYALDDEHLLLVASDRISAFDVVLPDPVPSKGIVLTQLSLFWFRLLEDVAENHLVEDRVRVMPEPVRRRAEMLAGRTLMVRRAKVFPVECILRGRLLGSGWKDYQASGSLSGIPLPPGLQKNAALSPPLFTPSTKAEAGQHDQNISFERMQKLVGKKEAHILRDKSLEVFERARKYAATHGIVICDTKLEWGQTPSGIILVDELLTPDSSRFWKLDEALGALQAGLDPPSYDKQVVRDHLETLDWNKEPPGPSLPADILNRARRRYIEIYETLTGQPVPGLDSQGL